MEIDRERREEEGVGGRRRGESIVTYQHGGCLPVV